jgi:hypothetical protein
MTNDPKMPSLNASEAHLFAFARSSNGPFPGLSVNY